MVSTNTQISAVFVVLAVALWYGVSQITDSTVVPLVILIGIGLVVPLGVNIWRARQT